VNTRRYYPCIVHKNITYSCRFDRSLPGAETVGAVSSLPLSNSGNLRMFAVDGYPNRIDQLAEARWVTRVYFSPMTIPLIAGLSAETRTGPRSRWPEKWWLLCWRWTDDRTQNWDSSASPSSRKWTPRSNSSSLCQKMDEMATQGNLVVGDPQRYRAS
jgi:hypothetical protein